MEVADVAARLTRPSDAGARGAAEVAGEDVVGGQDGVVPEHVEGTGAADALGRRRTRTAGGEQRACFWFRGLGGSREGTQLGGRGGGGMRRGEGSGGEDGEPTGGGDDGEVSRNGSLCSAGGALRPTVEGEVLFEDRLAEAANVSPNMRVEEARLKLGLVRTVGG